MPGFLKKYFWDVNFSKLDKDKYPYFVIERILEYGDKRALKWMRKNFEQVQIKNVLRTSRNLFLKSANFWQLIFGLDKDEILCLKESSQRKQDPIWRH